MTEPLVRYGESGGVATITLDSPSNRNALSRVLRAQLIEALEAAIDTSDVRVIVVTHTGPVFCSGMDLKESAVAAEGDEGVREVPRILRLISHSPKPIIARIAGPARAGGVGIIAAADISVAIEHATFAFSEVRIGVIPAVISVPVLDRISSTAARELFLTGDIFGAQRAVEIGLINRVAGDAENPGGLDTAVNGYVASVLKGGPLALSGTKDLLNQRRDDSEERYALLLDESARRFSSEEGREGAAAFAEKRPPRWTLR